MSKGPVTGGACQACKLTPEVVVTSCRCPDVCGAQNRTGKVFDAKLLLRCSIRELINCTVSTMYSFVEIRDTPLLLLYSIFVLGDILLLLSGEFLKTADFRFQCNDLVVRRFAI